MMGRILSFHEERRIEVMMKRFSRSPASSGPSGLYVIIASGDSKASLFSSTQVSISGLIPHTACVIPCSVTETDALWGPEYMRFIA